MDILENKTSICNCPNYRLIFSFIFVIEKQVPTIKQTINICLVSNFVKKNTYLQLIILQIYIIFFLLSKIVSTNLKYILYLIF